MIKHICLLPLVLCLGSVALAQANDAATTLVPGQPLERQIAGGESHTYQINLAAGQFVRFRLAQRAIDGALILTAPDGKQRVEIDVTGAGDEESLSLEVAMAGSYRLIVRGNGQVEVRGSYRLEATVQTRSTAEDRKRVAAEALLVEANELLKQGDKTAQQQIEKLDQALLLWRELGDTYWAAMTLSRIGTANYALNNYEKAIDYHQQAIAVFRELKHRYREGLTLSNIAISYYYLKQYDKSIDHYEQALPIFREGKNRADEGDVFYRLSFTALGLHRYEKAIEYAEQALAIARELKDRKREADTLSNISNFYMSLGQTEKSITYGEQSLAVYRELKDRKGEAKVLTNFGFTYSAMGRSEKAIEFNEQALTIAREMKNRSVEMYTLKNLGDCYYQLSRWEKAIEYYEQALVVSRESKDHTEEAGAARNVEAGTLLAIGQAYSALSRSEKAIEFIEQGLAITREAKSRVGEMYALENLGGVYRSLGRNEKAIEYFEQALAISREVKSRNAEAQTLNALGAAHSNLRHYEKAIECYEQALPLYRELKGRIGEAVTLSSLGGAYTDLGRSQKAINYLEQALAIYRETKSRVGEGYALNKLGLVYNGLNRPEKAIEYHEQALVISRAVYDRSMEAGALYGLASAERAQGDLSASRIHIEQSLAIVESLRSNEISSPELRASFLTSFQNSYQLYTDVLMRQHQAEPTKGFDALAVETSERQRARSLLDLLTESRTDLRQGVDVALLERERSLGKQLNDKARLLTQAKPEQADALKKEISQLETDYERAQAAIRKASPHYAALVQPQSLKLKDIQAQLDADTLLLEYALGKERSYVWAITRDSLTSYELPKGELIEKNARQVYELLTARSSSTRGETVAQRQERISEAEAQLPAAARGLSQIILAPVAAQLGNKRLVVVADGALQYIPFAMLPEPSVVISQLSVEKNNGPRTTDNGQPLIVKHEVVSIPSASALAIQRSELAGRQPAPKMLAVIADPVFDRSDSRFTTPETETGDKAQTRTINGDDARSIEHLAENSGDKSGVTTVRMAIPRLPFTRQEANQLMALAPKGSSFSAIDFQASRATALDPALSQYRYVHIATHGLLDTERPGLSALVFSMVDAEGKPQNGFLRANDIYNLKLPAELLVLSACQTGLGKDIKGEGLVGLTRGFMYAGAARVVVSLWNVNDKATADLMTKFYEKMLKKGQPPAAALRAGQVEMWKQKQWRSPYYWAAFTMQGEWR